MIGSSDKGWRSTSARNNEVQPQRLPGGAESAGIQSSGDRSSATMGEVGSARRASGLLERLFQQKSYSAAPKLRDPSLKETPEKSGSGAFSDGHSLGSVSPETFSASIRSTS